MIIIYQKNVYFFNKIEINLHFCKIPAKCILVTEKEHRYKVIMVYTLSKQQLQSICSSHYIHLQKGQHQILLHHTH